MAKESEKEVLGKLGAVPLFSGLKEKQLKTILASSKRIDYPGGKTIVTEGEMGVAFYLILSGKVEVRRKGKVLAKLGSGNFFGEMSLLDNNPRSSDVVAAEPTTCLVLSAWTFQGKIKSDHELAVNLITALVHRLRETNKEITD